MINQNIMLKYCVLLKKYGYLKSANNIENKLINDISNSTNTINEQLVYCDYLEENGQDIRAEYLRIRINPDFTGKNFDELNKEQQHVIEHIQTNDIIWMRSIAPTIEVKCPHCGELAMGLDGRLKQAYCECQDEDVESAFNFLFTIGTKYKPIDDFNPSMYLGGLDSDKWWDFV